MLQEGCNLGLWMSGHHHGVSLHRGGLGNLEMEPTFSIQVAAK